MKHDKKIDWIRAVDAANIHIREVDMMHACVGSQTVVAADTLIREQAEQIATLDTECLRLGIEEAKLQTKVEMLTSERDALAAVVLAAKMQICLHPNGALAAAEINAINNAPAILAAHDAVLVGPLKAEIQTLHDMIHGAGGFVDRMSEKDAEILRLENSILEADDYRTETGERDTMRAYRHLNAEAAGIREGREKIALEKNK